MQPESSDGFASVGTILPEEKAAQLPGGFFRFCARKLPASSTGRTRSRFGIRKTDSIPEKRMPAVAG
jgi:hypothetical protein